MRSKLADFMAMISRFNNIQISARGSYGRYPIAYRAELLDRQGRVHARVSVDFAKEFGCYLAVPLRQPGG
jgi:hypothetical protein